MEGCNRGACKYDHGYWGRPEDYSRYRHAHLRRTYTINADTAGTEVWAGASAALSAAHLLLRRHDALYARRLLRVSRTLYACAMQHNPDNLKLQVPLPPFTAFRPHDLSHEPSLYVKAWARHLISGIASTSTTSTSMRAA